MKSRRFILWTLVLFLFFIKDNASTESISLPSSPQKRTLTRRYDVIKIRGDFLSPFDNVPIQQLRLLAFKNGEITPIPFQIDERDPTGKLVMSKGKTASKDDDNGLLDSNDELVFMVMDAGDKLSDKEKTDKIEIEITDPRYSDKKAWVYLEDSKSPYSPRSPIDYVNYEPSSERIISKNYILGYRKGFMFYNDLIYPSSVGGNGMDFLDRIKVRFKVEFFKGKMVIERSEDSVKAEVTGWIDGPVRVVQASVNHVKLFDMLPPIGFDSLSEYYSTLMASPITVKIPFDLNKITKALGVRTIIADIYGDMPGLVEGKAYTNLCLEGFEHTGHMPVEIYNKIPKKGIQWGFVSKKGVGTWFPRVVFPDPMYQYNNYYLKDDVSFHNPPEDVPGEIAGGVRLILTDYPPELIEQIGTESFMLMFETYFAKPGTSSAEAKEWLDIQDHPLIVGVKFGSNLKPKPKKNSKKSSLPPWKGGCDGTITDNIGRKIPLKKIAFFIGSIDVDARLYFGGERVEDKTFHKLALSQLKSMENYIVDYDPYTKTKMAMFTKIKLKSGEAMNLMSCKACGWAGVDEDSRVVYLSNSQISRIDFSD